MLEGILNLLIPSALAGAPATQDPTGGGMAQMMMLLVFALIFYFLLWRPQSKRAKEHRKMVESLQKGDEVVTNGGILGKISQVFDDFIELKISDSVEIRLQKHAVGAVLPKGSIQATKAEKNSK